MPVRWRELLFARGVLRWSLSSCRKRRLRVCFGLRGRWERLQLRRRLLRLELRLHGDLRSAAMRSHRTLTPSSRGALNRFRAVAVPLESWDECAPLCFSPRRWDSPLQRHAAATGATEAAATAAMA